jgi:hypothetical protein
MFETKGRREDATMAIVKITKESNNFEHQRYFKLM